jgi:hypothetical protein
MARARCIFRAVWFRDFRSWNLIAAQFLPAHRDAEFLQLLSTRRGVRNPTPGDISGSCGLLVVCHRIGIINVLHLFLMTRRTNLRYVSQLAEKTINSFVAGVRDTAMDRGFF